MPKDMQPTKSIITINEARKLLGKPAEVLSDDQVLEVINDLTAMARTHRKIAGSKKAFGV